MEVDRRPASRSFVRGYWGYLAGAVIPLVLFFLFLPQLVSRYYYQQGVHSLGQDDLGPARIALGKARDRLGILAFDNDRKRINIAEGDLRLRRAETSKTVTDFLVEMVEAEKLYRAATDIQPLDIDGYTGLARATTALATVYPFVLHQPFPTKALPILEHLLGLMPVNLLSLSLLTKYYHVNKLDDELQAIVARSITTFPPFYSQLINQPFYTVGMNEMITTSLHTAIKNGVYVTEAYKALSRLALQEEDNQGAIDYFLKARPVAGYQDNSGYSLQLGRLYLLTGQVAEAEGSFLDALKTTGLEKRLDEIWAQYKMAKQYKPFLDFCKSAEGEKSLSEQLQLLRAKCFIEMERYELALSHLIRMNSPKYEAEGLYLQARIAEFLQDWDTMELRSQRATVIDGGNSSYLLLFSRALQNQKKWPQAEQAATAAIASSTVPNPWLYNHRAWLRWNRKDYDGAKTDWQKAIGLSPETAGFYYSMGLVYQQGKNINEAVRYLKKALTIKPGDQRYREKLTELTALQ